MIRDNFFGRQEYLKVLEKRARDLKEGYRQNIAIIGDELVGKTSLVFKFLDRFQDNLIVPVYIEARPEPLADFSRRFIGILLYNFLLNSGLELKEDLEFLTGKAARFIPRTAEKAKAILSAVERRKKNDIFAEIMGLCETLHQESGKSCVVIFDEFQNLENIGIKNLYQEWSKLLIAQKNTMYIITSSLKFKAKNILAKNLSLLFGNFEVLNIEPFDTAASNSFLEGKLSGMGIESGLKNFLIHFCAGNPFYLELISGEMLKSGPKQSLPDLLENLLFMPAGTLNQKFTNYIKRFLDNPFSRDYVSILYLVSSGHNKIRDIAQLMRKQKKELALRINYLLELDVISRNGDFLKINDRVFGFWLRFVYQEKMQSLTFDARAQKMLFRDKIEGMVQEFLASSRKPLSERMVELLRLFQDETMQIEKKRLRLSRFREIKTLEFGGRGLKDGIIGRSCDDLWIIALKQEPLTEEDIAEFSRECRRYRNKPQRKIIITLNEVDPNTRLRAMEEKVWTWDLNHLNQMFDLFYKPRVIA